MSALAEFETRFLAALFGPGEPTGRLAAYRRNVLGTLGDALAAAYPAVRRLVGVPFFEEAARRYALATPSSCGDLHAFGARFGAFLDAYGPAGGVPYLGDVARLEWAVHECHHAADGARLDAAACAIAAAAEPEGLRFRLQPAARLVASEYPVHAIREANLEGDGVPSREAGPDFVLVRREGLRVVVERLAPDEWRFLERLGRGEPLGVACEAFGEDAAQRLGGVLARHAGAGLFCACEAAA